MEKPRRFLNKLELGIEVGYVVIPYELEMACRDVQCRSAMNRDFKSKESITHTTYDPYLDLAQDSQNKDSERKISNRMRKIIDSIMDSEEILKAREKIKENDMLKPLHFETPIKLPDYFPKKEYHSKDNAFDRNQFIRSFFRYKNCTVKNNCLYYNGREICQLLNCAHEDEITSQFIIFSKSYSSDEILNINFSSEITPAISMFAKLYSFDEIININFPSRILRNKKTKEIKMVEFPLSPSVIEKVAKKYGIEPIMFWKSTIKYLFESDLRFLEQNIPCLKFRNFTITHNFGCFALKDNDGGFKKIDCAQGKYLLEKKVSLRPRLIKIVTGVIVGRETGELSEDEEAIKKILKFYQLNPSENMVFAPIKPCSMSINEKSNIITEFFEKLPAFDKVCVIYETDNDALTQIGDAKYDKEKRIVSINNLTIRIETIISLHRTSNYKE